jgi:CheY-like chemotaxis protein
VSLLGRLEDLSLADIIQIVYLSRRTGILEVQDTAGEHALLFRNGLLVEAKSPTSSDLKGWLATNGIFDPKEVTTDVLAEAIRERITEIVKPLLESREGEFRFVLSDDPAAIAIDYDPETLFREGGLPPQKILGTVDRPLRGLEESLKAGKALVRNAPPPENIVAFPAAQLADETLPLGTREDTSQFRVAGGLIAVESPEARMRNVVLYERDPLIRVAAKRAFAKREISIAQFGLLDDVRKAVHEWFRLSAFFVTVLEVDDGSAALLREIKRRNPRLPVAMIDASEDLQRRHDLIRAGADFYLTKPVSTMETELRLFADELIVFTERAFEQWAQLAAAWGEGAGKRFYEEAEREHNDRTFDLLKQFISELSNPNDISELGATILRLAGDYLDRAALFVVYDDVFAGIANASSIRIDRHAPSVLSEVAGSAEQHRGKMKRTAANEQLLTALGGALPTEVVALPIVHNGRTIGILYGDNATHRAPIDTLTGLEVFLSQAGYAFGNAVAASERAGTS